MVVSTVDEAGAPDSRYVVVHGADDRGVVFYTNYESTKSRQLMGRPVAAVLGRLAPGAVRGGVLARPTQPPPRPPALHERRQRGRLAHPAPGAVTPQARPSARALRHRSATFGIAGVAVLGRLPQR